MKRRTSTRRPSRIALWFLYCAITSIASAVEPITLEPITLDPRVEAAEQARIAAVKRAMPSTVSVFVPGGGGGGSGVLISPNGLALTNFHVSSPAGTYMRCGLSDGRIYDAVIVGIDPVGDLALIRLLGRDDFPFAEMADSLKAQVGQWCMVIGNPFLLNTNLEPTVSWGILSGVGRYQYPSGTLLEYADCLQTDASINPGNSGGPLYDADGKLLGIVGRASFEKRGRVNVGVGYAISIQQAKNFLSDLQSGRIVDHATLGATVASDPEGGVRVSNILDTSDAYRRGLRYGDEILEIDGRAVSTANQVQNVLATFPALWRVRLTYRNDEGVQSTLVRLANVHGQDELLEKMAAALPPPPPAPDPKPDKDADESKNAEENNDQGGEPKAIPIPGNIPIPGPHGEPAAEGNVEIPDVVNAMFEARRGYANYHFNLLKQTDFIIALKSQFPGNVADSKHGSWVITGTTIGNDSKPVKISVADQSFELSIGEKTIMASKASELYDGITARNPSGVIACLNSWRRMLREGTEQFGECYYRGTVPLLGERPLRDWMVGVSGELEASWLSHPVTKNVEVIEVFADRDDDPVEMIIRWGDSSTNRPESLEVRYGTDTVLAFKIDDWNTDALTKVAQ